MHFSCHLCTQDNRDHLHYLPHNLCHHSLLRHHRSPPMTAKTKTKRGHNLTLTSNPNPTYSDYFMLQHSSHVKAQHGIWYNNTFGTMMRILLSCIPLVWYSFNLDPIKKSELTFFCLFCCERSSRQALWFFLLIQNHLILLLWSFSWKKTCVWLYK